MTRANQFPLAARYFDRVECKAPNVDDATNARVLGRVRALLRAIGPFCTDPHPHLMEPYAIDAIGRMLGEDHETYRVALMESQPPDQPRAFVVRRLYKVMTVAQAEAMDDASRALIVPLRGDGDRVALPLPEDQRPLAETTVLFAKTEDSKRQGAKLTVREQLDPDEFVVDLVSETGKRKRLQGTLPSDRRTCLTNAFDTTAIQEQRQSAEEPVAARKLEFVKKEGSATQNGDMDSWDMPTWLMHQTGAVLQNVVRLHVLLSAARTDGLGAAVYVGKLTLTHVRRPKHDVPHWVLKARLHSASGKCVCRAHARGADDGPSDEVPVPVDPDHVEIRVRMCGMPIKAGGLCDVHVSSGAGRCSACPGLCTKQLRVSLACVHGSQNNRGLFHALPDSHTLVSEHQRVLTRLMHSAIRTARATSLDQAAVMEMETAMAQELGNLDRQRLCSGLTHEAMLSRDEGVKRKLLGAGLPSSLRLRDIEPTHGQLLPKKRKSV